MIRVNLLTLGCKVNQYETQVLAQRFAAEGFSVTESADADIFVVNSCTVTAQGDRKCRQLLRRLRREHPQAVLALTGCFPQAFPEQARQMPEPDVITGSRDRAGLLLAVRKHLATGERVVSVAPHQRGESFEAMSAVDFRRHTRAFVKIEDGCENCCAYCIIPAARGPVRSKPLEELAAELSALAGTGHREVVLAGINLSSYGRDLGCRLIDAIELACGAEGLWRVRLGSLEPDLITPADIARMGVQPKLCPQFHLSLQSGSDAVLGRMGRRYSTDDYLAVAEEIRRRFPDAALTTDLMVGFPGETDEEFAQSVAFARRVGFAKIHVFSYSPREGTRAAALEGQVPPAVKKQRSTALLAVARELRGAFLSPLLGQSAEVLFEERNRDGSQTGYTRNYTPITITDAADYWGQIKAVLITQVAEDGCRGMVAQGGQDHNQPE